MHNRLRQRVLLPLAGDMSSRLRAPLELMVVIAIITLLIGLATKVTEAQILKTQLVEAFALSASPRIEATVYRAEHGDWPTIDARLNASVLEKNRNHGRYVQSLELGSNGAYTVIFGGERAVPALANGRLGMQAAVVEGSPGSPIVWTCGAFPAPKGMMKIAVDTTELESKYLPFICQGK